MGPHGQQVILGKGAQGRQSAGNAVTRQGRMWIGKYHRHVKAKRYKLKINVAGKSI